MTFHAPKGLLVVVVGLGLVGGGVAAVAAIEPGDTPALEDATTTTVVTTLPGDTTTTTTIVDDPSTTTTP